MQIGLCSGQPLDKRKSLSKCWLRTAPAFSRLLSISAVIRSSAIEALQAEPLKSLLTASFLLSRMEAIDAKKLNQFTAATAAFDMGHKLDRIPDLTLNGVERQAGVSLEREPRQAIQRVGGGTGMEGGDRACVPRVEGLQQIVGRAVAHLPPRRCGRACAARMP